MEDARPRVAAAALALLSAFVLATCGAPGAPSRDEIVDSRDIYDPRSLDPALSTDVPTGRAVGYLFDGLTRFTPDARVEPSLATRWEISPDGRRYTFHLRTDVSFHDGAHFTAKNVVASWERALAPATKSGAAQFLFPIAGAKAFNGGTAKSIAGLAAPNDSTLIVALDEPLAIFTKMLAMPVASVVPLNTPPNFGEHPIGTGPWKLVTWKHDDFLLFSKNPGYFGGAPKTDTLRARIIAEPSTAVAEYESGNVDVLQIPASEASEWVNDESRSPMLMSTPALELVYIGINTTRGPLADPRVRRAINYAVDVNRIIERLVGGRGIRANGVIPPTLPGHDSSRAPYAYDPAKARQLLAASGHANGIDVELWVSTNPIYQRIAETVQAYLNVVGIRTKIVLREAAASRAAARKGETDMILKDWYADYPDAEDFLYPLLGTANRGAGGNVSFYSNARFDSLMTVARREENEARRNALYRQADSIAFADAPMVFLHFYDELYAVQPWIRHFVPPVIFNGQRWLDVTIDRSPPSPRPSK